MLEEFTTDELFQEIGRRSEALIAIGSFPALEPRGEDKRRIVTVQIGHKLECIALAQIMVTIADNITLEIAQIATLNFDGDDDLDDDDDDRPWETN